MYVPSLIIVFSLEYMVAYFIRSNNDGIVGYLSASHAVTTLDDPADLVDLVDQSSALRSGLDREQVHGASSCKSFSGRKSLAREKHHGSCSVGDSRLMRQGHPLG
jgi:hypothetical protein